MVLATSPQLCRIKLMPDDIAAILRADRLTWEQHGVLPGEEKLRHYLDRLGPALIEEADLVFLWASCAMVTFAANENEEDLELQHMLGEITEHVASVAVPVAGLVDDLGARSLESIQKAVVGGSFVLEDGTVMHVEREVLEDGRRILVVRADRSHADAIEGAVLSGGSFQIRSLPEGSPLRRLPLI